MSTIQCQAYNNRFATRRYGRRELTVGDRCTNEATDLIEERGNTHHVCHKHATMPRGKIYKYDDDHVPLTELSDHLLAEAARAARLSIQRADWKIGQGRRLLEEGTESRQIAEAMLANLQAIADSRGIALEPEA